MRETICYLQIYREQFMNKKLDWFNNVEDRPHPWPGLNWLTATLIIKNVKQATEFYENVFGFVTIFELPSIQNDKELDFARMRYRGCNFIINREGCFNFNGKQPTNETPPIIFYVYVDDVEHLALNAKNNSCLILEEPHLEFWGDKKTRLKDPFGYIWDFATKMK